MVYTARLFLFKMQLFYNSNVFSCCIIHILYTGCAKIKKNNSGAKRLITTSTKPTNFIFALRQMNVVHARGALICDVMSPRRLYFSHWCLIITLLIWWEPSRCVPSISLLHFFFLWRCGPNAGHDLLIFEVS